MGEIININTYKMKKQLEGMKVIDAKEIAGYLAEMDDTFDEINEVMNTEDDEWLDWLSELSQAPIFVRTRVIQATYHWVMEKNEKHPGVGGYFGEIANRFMKLFKKGEKND